MSRIAPILLVGMDRSIARGAYEPTRFPEEPSFLCPVVEVRAPWPLAARPYHGLQQKREAPDRFQPLVVGALEGTDFACTDADAVAPTVLHTFRGGLQRWRGRPLHPELRVRFATSSVLSFALRGESFKGRVFALDKPGLTSDDLFLGQVVAQQLTAQMDHFYFLEQLREGATTEERLRLARDLHDGVLQSLSGTALQLQAARQLLDRDPGAARERLLDIQCLIADEQRDLRHTIHYLKPATSSPPEPELSLTARMRELARRLERHWGVRVELSSGALEGRIPNTLARHIYSLVHEGLINAARHSGGSAARAMIRASSDHVHIVVADNGRGFPFRGRYDLATLRAQNLGPMTLKERVAALGGTMIIESVESGARLELTVPLEPRVA